MSLSIPFTFTGGPGNKARASEVNTNFQAIAKKFTEEAGGIVDADIYTFAAIKGSKLSNVAGNRVPSDRIEDDAIGAAQLKDEASPSTNAAVNSANHIKDGIITNAKLVNATLLAGKIKINSVNFGAQGVVVPTGAAINFTTGKTAAQIVPLALYSERAGGADLLDDRAIVSLYHRTSDDLYYFSIHNPHDAPFTIINNTFYWLLYIDKA